MRPAVFHLAFNVRDLDEARAFYSGLLGCREGRSAPTWVDFDFFGHQISVHLGKPLATAATGLVGEHRVPMPHFGVVLEQAAWETLAARLRTAEMPFIIAPVLRFAGEPGEQSTMFFTDPSGNPIEIKGLRSLATLYDA